METPETSSRGIQGFQGEGRKVRAGHKCRKHQGLDDEDPTNRTWKNVTVGDHSCKPTKGFLGYNVNNTNFILQEIVHRLVEEDRALHAYHKIMKPRLVQRNTKVKIYKRVVIRRVVTYECVTWALTCKE